MSFGHLCNFGHFDCFGNLLSSYTVSPWTVEAVTLWVPELGIYIVSIVLIRSVIGYSTFFLASNLQSAPVDKSEIEV